MSEKFNQDNESLRELASKQGGLVAYTPKSKAPKKLDTLIPSGMAFESQNALNKVVKAKGDIDQLVADELKYPSKDDLWTGFRTTKNSGLAAEQVDALGLYLLQFEREKGIIVADQTGIGKGRTAASVIRHAVVNGYLPIFFTRKESLFTDIYRDLQNIGHTALSPFLLNTTSEAKVKDQEGKKVFEPMTRQAQHKYINQTREVKTDSEESLAYHKENNLHLPDLDNFPKVELSDPLDHLPEEFDMIFSTYHQIQSAHPSKKIWLKNIIKNGVEGSKKYKKVVLVLDECHMAGGYDTKIGKWFREVLPETKSACFLSATFAKYPQVMPLYMAKTALSEAQMSELHLVHSMTSGGLALQEIIASLLVQSGQLIRRQRSRKGVEVNYITIDQEPERTKIREKVDIIVSVMNDIVAFESQYIIPYLNKKQIEVRKQGNEIENRPRNLGVKSSPFFSRVFNIVDQMLFSLKVKAVAKKALQLLNEDKKVVIAFKSTMGSYLEELQLTAGDKVRSEQLDFAKTLIKALDSTLKYSFTDLQDSTKSREVNLKELPAGASLMYKAIKEDILSVSTGLHTSPIDQLIAIIQSTRKKEGLGGHKGDYFRVEEVTGRNKRIVIEDGEGILENFKPQPEKSFRLFNSGAADVLLINQSGSTGFSAHASEDFKDQRQRHMISHQFELDINIEVQKWGRTGRTGQVVLPVYHYMITDVPIEKRLMNMLKSKLKKLDANTTGSQKTNDSSLQSPDFFNVIGDKVAFDYITENPEMEEKLYYPTYHRNWDGELERNSSAQGAMRQVTGRAGLLPVKDQDQLFNELMEKYIQEVDYRKQNGTYDLEVEYMPLDAKVKERFLYRKGKGGFSPFGKDTIREINTVKNLKKPYTQKELSQRISQLLDSKSPEEVVADLIIEIETQFPLLIEKRTKEKYQELRDLHQQLEDYQLPSPDQEKAFRKAEIEISRLTETISKKEQNLDKIETDLNHTKKSILNMIDLWKIGDAIKVPDIWSSEGVLGIYLGVSINRSAKNPYTLGNISLLFAISDTRKLLDLKIGGDQRGEIAKIKLESDSLSDEEKHKVTKEWDQLTKDLIRPTKTSTILTGNILLVSNEISQGKKLIKYNKMDGTLVNGILVSDKLAVELSETKATYPINFMLPYLEGLSINNLLGDSKNSVIFKKESDQLFDVTIKKNGNEEIYTNGGLRQLLEKPINQDHQQLADFVHNGGDMKGVVHHKRLQLFLDKLTEFGLTFYGEATEVAESEVEEEIDQDFAKGIFKYALSEAVENNNYPLENFKTYEQPDSDYRLGVLVYDRKLPLTEREKYKLIPAYKNIEVPVQQWKKKILASDKREVLSKQLEMAKSLNIFQAFESLGEWMINNVEGGIDPLYTFGNFTKRQLGNAIFNDMVRTIERVDIYKEQLKIALQAA